MVCLIELVDIVVWEFRGCGVEKCVDGGCDVGKAGGEIAWVFKERVVKLPVDGEIVV